MAEEKEETQSIGEAAKNLWDAFKNGASNTIGGIVGALTGNNDEEDETQNEDTLESEQSGAENNGSEIYILNNNDSNHPEVYTSEQIDEMRTVISAMDQENYGISMNAGQEALADGKYAEEVAKTSDRGTTHLDGRTTSFRDMNESTETASEEWQSGKTDDFGKGQHDIIVDIKGDSPDRISCDNKIDIKTDGMTYQTFTSEECDHMKELVAEADAIDGKGTYEDNLDCLMSHDYEQYSESQSLENEQENVYVIKTDPSAQNTEAYTSSQIDTMRMIVSQHDGLCTADLSDYQRSDQTEAIAGTSTLNEHYINGEFCGELGTDVKSKITAEADATELTEDNFVEGRGSLACKDYKGEDVSTEFNNSLKIDPMHVEFNGWSDEDYSHMEEIIAVADACDGKGTYNSNLEQLQELNPEYQNERSLDNPYDINPADKHVSQEQMEQQNQSQTDYDSSGRRPYHKFNTDEDDDAKYADQGIDDEIQTDETEDKNSTDRGANKTLTNMAKVAMATAVSQRVLDNEDLTTENSIENEKY